MRFLPMLTPNRRIFGAFCIYAFSMGNIFPRLGDVQIALGVSEGPFGLALIGAPVGTLSALTFGSRLVERLGAWRVLLFCPPLVALLYAIAVQAPSTLMLFLMLIPVGVVVGLVEIMINLEADRIEHMVGKRIMNRSHAFWSIGFFSAGIFGAGMAWLGLSPQLHLALVVPLSAVGIWLFMKDFVAAPARPGTSTDKAPRFAIPTPAILMLVVVTLSAMLLEGASMDWSAIYMRDTFAAGPFLAGISVAFFAVSQGVLRYFADGFLERRSPVLVARVLLTMLMIGCVLVSFSPAAPISLLGFALMGIGTSAIFPLAISVAAQQPERSAAVNVAALAQTSFTAFLVGPPLLGIIAEHWGIRAAFGAGLPVILLSLWATSSLAPRIGKAIRA